jgi:hypothetical protein
MELPVAAFRVPGVIDTVEDKVTGRLVDPLNVRQVAATVGDYLRDGALRRHTVRRHECASRNCLDEKRYGQH